MFLPASIKVRVQSRYANSDSMYALIEEFKSWNRVDDVEFNEPLLVRVQENLALINTTALSLGIIVILASIDCQTVALIAQFVAQFPHRLFLEMLFVLRLRQYAFFTHLNYYCKINDEITISDG